MKQPPKSTTGSGKKKRTLTYPDGTKGTKTYPSAAESRRTWEQDTASDRPDKPRKTQQSKPTPLSNARMLEQQPPKKKTGPMATPAWATKSRKGTTRYT